MTQASAIGGSRIAPTGLVAQVAAFYLFEKMDREGGYGEVTNAARPV